jgi:ABC-2 type transport system permease protein
LPPVCRAISQIIPATWLIDASRGVILRGASWPELWPHAVVLWTMALVMIAVSSAKLRKRLS